MPNHQLTRDDVVRRTHMAQHKVKNYLKTADALRQDPEQEKREAEGLCKPCHYTQGMRLGGAAFTTSDCHHCGKEMRFGSTATDRLCLDCANQLHLCKQCAGQRDLDMDNIPDL